MAKVMDKSPDESSDISHWAIDGYNLVTENGISDGTRPKDTITREELWTMLHEYHKMKG
jgi:hypothetical protein